MKPLITFIFSNPSIRPRLTSLTVLGLGLLVLVVLYFFNPAASPLFPPCPFHALTGWLCPGCGTLRGLHQLLHGHPSLAWKLNPLMLLTLPLLLGAGASHLFTVMRGQPLPRPHIQALWIWLLLIAVVGFGVGRNW